MRRRDSRALRRLARGGSLGATSTRSLGRRHLAATGHLVTLDYSRWPQKSGLQCVRSSATHHPRRRRRLLHTRQRRLQLTSLWGARRRGQAARSSPRPGRLTAPSAIACTTGVRGRRRRGRTGSVVEHGKMGGIGYNVAHGFLLDAHATASVCNKRCSHRQ